VRALVRENKPRKEGYIAERVFSENNRSDMW